MAPANNKKSSAIKSTPDPSGVDFAPGEDESPQQYLQRQETIVLSSRLRIKKLAEELSHLIDEEKKGVIKKNDPIFAMIVNAKANNDLIISQAVKRINKVMGIVSRLAVMEKIEDATAKAWKDYVEWGLFDPKNQIGGYIQTYVDKSGKILMTSGTKKKKKNDYSALSGLSKG
ncbi:MAG: hypothetical protein JAY72_20520 [Candidatus Thiodiazotropha endolucinida]|nr:hypothetical protein [Candidatus Thiodiazotropha taylori]MCW4324067.1 hypothetical protein [Candidatus Thiodiazotropha taylori]